MRFENMASQSVTIQATPEQVWEALVNPRLIKKYMFGADVRSEWKEGSPITWNGESGRKRFEGVKLALTQDNNPTDEARRLSEVTWKKALHGLKDLLER